MGSTILDRPSCRCFRKRSCCTIWTIWIPKWRRCGPTSSARLNSKDRGPAITHRWDVRCSIRVNLCRARKRPPRKTARKIPARSRPPQWRGNNPLPQRRRLTCSANRKHRSNIASIESAPEDRIVRLRLRTSPGSIRVLASTNFDIGGEDYAFSCAVLDVHFPVVYTRGLLEEARRYRIQLREPRHSSAVECCRRKCDEFSNRASRSSAT